MTTPICSQRDAEALAVMTSKPLIVYQAPWNWDFLWNRAQPLATALAAHATVVYLDIKAQVAENPESLLPGSGPIPYGGMETIAPSLYRYRWLVPETHAHLARHVTEMERSDAQHAALREALAPLVAQSDRTWLITSHPHAAGLLHLRAWDRIIVDLEDPWLSLDWGQKIQPEVVTLLLNFADSVFANGPKIAQEYEALSGRAIHSLPNGVDESFLDAIGAEHARPAFMTHPENVKCAVFTGNINCRLDLAALEEVIARLRDVPFYFVGCVNLPEKDNAEAWKRISARANVHCPGEVPHDQIAAILSHADILLLPYHQMGGPLMFPAKLYEYLAAGSVIVSPQDFRETLPKNKLVVTYRSTEAMAAVLASVSAGTLGVAPKEKEHGRRIARQNTWDGRAAQMMAAIERDCERENGRARTHRVTREEIDRQVDLSETLYNAGEREGAKELLRRLSVLSPFNARVMNNLGVIHRHEGNVSEALAALRAAISRNRYDYSANYHTAQLLQEIGHKEVSEALFEHVKLLKRRIERTQEADAIYRYLQAQRQGTESRRNAA